MSALDAISHAMTEREKDFRFRQIVDSTVIDVLQTHPHLEHTTTVTRTDIYRLLTEAVTLALTRTYESDAEIKMLRMERDHYRKIAEESLSIHPIRPLILPADSGFVAHATKISSHSDS